MAPLPLPLPVLAAAGFGLGLADTLVVDTASPGVPQPPIARADPRKQVAGTARPGIGDALERLDSYRGGYGWHSTELYRRMLDTPAVGASFNALRSAMLQSKVDLLPAIGTVAGDADPGLMAAASEAAQVCEANKRLLHMMETPLDLVLWEACEAMYLGHVLCEVVFDDVRGGPDDGLWYIKRIRPLRLGDYRLRVDAGLNLVAVECHVVRPDGTTEWGALDPDHFWLLSWDTYRGDPRGRSVFRQAVHAWQMLVELWPDVLSGWKQFGTPMLVAELAPDAEDVVVRDAAGNPLPGTPRIPVVTYTAAQVQKLRGGATMAVPHGGKVYVVESNKSSSVVAGAVEILEGQIVKSILLTTRGTTEAKHGSRADSETAQDVTGTAVRIGKKWLERAVRRLFATLNAMNYGPDVARRSTPLVDLGSTDAPDFAANATAVAALAGAGIIQPSQYPSVFAHLGLSMPTEAELAALAAAQQAGLANATGDPEAPPDPNASTPPSDSQEAA